MSLLGKKRGEDIIDFTRYHKTPSRVQTFEEDKVIDFSSPKNQDSEHKPVVGGDFISDLASFGSSFNSENNNGRTRNENSEINELRIKLEDNEYKMNLLVSRITELERKLRDKI